MPSHKRHRLCTSLRRLLAGQSLRSAQWHQSGKPPRSRHNPDSRSHRPSRLHYTRSWQHTTTVHRRQPFVDGSHNCHYNAPRPPWAPSALLTCPTGRPPATSPSNRPQDNSAPRATHCRQHAPRHRPFRCNQEIHIRHNWHQATLQPPLPVVGLPLRQTSSRQQRGWPRLLMLSCPARRLLTT